MRQASGAAQRGSGTSVVADPGGDRGDDSPRGKEFGARQLLRRAIYALTSLHGAFWSRNVDWFDVIVKALGPMLVAFALLLIGFVVGSFFAYVLPDISERSSFLHACNVVSIGMFLLLNLSYNYAMAVIVDPGMPPEYEGMPLRSRHPEADTLGESWPAPRQCPKCMRQKPGRTHHCSVCQRCVLRMDHHCPWINNCVGFHNQRYFCLFLWYLAAGCVYVVITFFSTFWETMLHPRRSHHSFFARQCVSLSWILSACILMALALLGGFQLYLVLTNQTTIEFHINSAEKDKAKRAGVQHRNPYDLGNKVRNFQEVFGPSRVSSFRWAMPYLALAPVGNGMSFRDFSPMPV